MKLRTSSERNQRAAPSVGAVADRPQAGGSGVIDGLRPTGLPEVLVKRQANINENQSDPKDRRGNGGRDPGRLDILPTRR